MNTNRQSPGELTTPTSATDRMNVATAKRPGQLRVRLVGSEPAVFDLENGSTITFGRSRASQVMLAHPSVSKVHFCLRAVDGGVELEDLGSKNGTWFQTRRVRRITLLPGDRFFAGSCEIEILGVSPVDVEVTTTDECGLLVGESVVMRELFARIEKLAPLPLDLLIQGETGTGKELTARTIHDLSPRRDRPFVILDCSTLATNLADATLFGFRRGAFTGADYEQAGLFEQADGGTLFIDEIGELSLELQMKFLRVLDRRQVVRLGEPGRLRDFNVRVVAATNRDLSAQVREGRFREDLFHRVAHAQLLLPPLRDREFDSVLLAERFLRELALEHDGPVEIPIEIGDDTKTAMVTYDWPGNVRELLNTIRRTALMCGGSTIRIEDLDLGRDHGWGFKLAKTLAESRGQTYKALHMQVDRVFLPAVLEEHRTMSATAERLGISRGTLRARLQALGLYAAEEM
jgi:DNA-binding NtrC family response regulator